MLVYGEVQLDNLITTKERYNTYMERIFGLDHGHLPSLAHGKAKTHKGWIYKGEVK